MFKVNIKVDWHRSGVFIVNVEHILHLVLVFLLLTLNMQLPAGASNDNLQIFQKYFTQ